MTRPAAWSRARSVDQDHPGLHRLDAGARDQAAGLVIEQQVDRDHVAFVDELVELDKLDALKLLWRAVPGDHAHAAAERNARDFRGDAAKTDQAERLAGELHAVLAQPVAGAHLT